MTGNQLSHTGSSSCQSRDPAAGISAAAAIISTVGNLVASQTAIAYTTYMCCSLSLVTLKYMWSFGSLELLFAWCMHLLFEILHTGSSGMQHWTGPKLPSVGWTPGHTATADVTLATWVRRQRQRQASCLGLFGLIRASWYKWLNHLY